MEAYAKCQDDIRANINRARVNYKKSPKDRITQAYVETRLDTLEQNWMLFTDTHRNILVEIERTDFEASAYYKDDLYGQTEELYVEYKSDLKTVLSTFQNKIESTNRSHTEPVVNVTQMGDPCCSVRLSDVSIPKFSGKYEEWTSFHDLFVSLVHKNARLDDVTKLRHLKSHLEGEAEQLLRHIPITNDNYAICWGMLERRYNNKKYLANCILRRLFSQKSMSVESSHAIKNLLDTTSECLSALVNLGIDTSSWDVMIIFLISSKLDSESRKQWELKACEINDELPKFVQFQTFLENRFRALEFIEPKSQPKPHHPTSPMKSLHIATPSTCHCCNESHKLSSCKKFVSYDMDTRRSLVQTSKLCFNCLCPNHSAFSCRQLSRCRICRKKHHTLLHPENAIVSTGTSEVKNYSVDKNVVAHASISKALDLTKSEEVVGCLSNTRSQVLLATALVKAVSPTGNVVVLRCLLDQGSQTCLITESAVQLLGLKKKPNKIRISGLGGDGNARLASQSLVTVSLHSLHDPEFKVEIGAHVLNKLTTFLPEKKVVFQSWSEFANLELADPEFGTPSKIDMLLGADVYAQILCKGFIKGPPGSLIAQETRLGWILSGRVNTSEASEDKNCHSTVVSLHASVDENELLKKFWEMELGTSGMNSIKHVTPEEQLCEDIFSQTTKRDDSGRYVVKLPFRDDDPQCKYGNSREIAAKRFLWLEKKLTSNPDFKKQYTAVINEYLNLGHAEVVPKEQCDNEHAVYLPHHAVVRNDRTTTKVRVVFDASCRGTNGVSLNNDMLIGPRLQLDLRHIIMRWREHPISIIADIVKMYRQVKVIHADADFQRLLWRDNSEDDLKHIRLLRVTFGTASAPYLAVRALQQVAHDEGHNFPIASERVLKDFYVDDLMTGCQSVLEGIQVCREINELLKRGGFELQKWSSSSDELLNEIHGDKQIDQGNLQLKEDDVMRILGLTWNRKDDVFEYSVQLPPASVPITKRKVISDISRLFDPLGWVAPIIIVAKIFIQRIWVSGIQWDQELPPDLLKDWLKFRDELCQVTNIKIPRWIHKSTNDVTYELHGFCDASNQAFAAVVYSRVVDSEGEVHVNLITSKTKVSPIKQVSIPRLELCGAVLLTKLLVDVSTLLKVPKSNVHAWTDSSVVLAWLSSHPIRWKTFVANRVSEILTAMDRGQWSHVSSKENPSDCASRGLKAGDCAEFKLWKEGPVWLKDKTIQYSPQRVEDTKLEEKTKPACHLTTDLREEDDICARFSSLRRMIRVLSYCRRFLRITNPLNTFSPWLTSSELQDTLKMCVRNCQTQNFFSEIHALKTTGIVSKKSSLSSFSPFIDDCGIIRVGGRLDNAAISNDMKHPIIIPHKSHLTNLMVADAHERTLHGGASLTVNYLQSRYRILGVKNLVKFFVRKCVVCIRYTAQFKNPLMGVLPAARVTPSRPFSQCGVDYAGPVNVRMSKGRGNKSYKGYICLFVCMATRAIHLEVVSDMTTQGFLAAFRRFTARRGSCHDVYSDNGTNFVGAARELRLLFTDEHSRIKAEIAEALASVGTTWHFVPPHSPNFGGIWESGIKSTKGHLKRVIGDSTLTFEELSTLLCQVEACLNSRPISYINSDTRDRYPLTPGHFLVGGPLVSAPDFSYENSNLGNLRRWQLTQRMLQDFWRRWSQEYLTQFWQRHKWTKSIPEPKIGDIVLIKEDNLPPAKWLYGIIVEKHSGLDKVTRVVSLRCNNSVIKRPISKLCILPVTE